MSREECCPPLAIASLRTRGPPPSLAGGLGHIPQRQPAWWTASGQCTLLPLLQVALLAEVLLPHLQCFQVDAAKHGASLK